MFFSNNELSPVSPQMKPEETYLYERRPSVRDTFRNVTLKGALMKTFCAQFPTRPLGTSPCSCVYDICTRQIQHFALLKRTLLGLCELYTENSNVSLEIHILNQTLCSLDSH